MHVLIAVSLFSLVWFQAAAPTATAVLSRYIQAIGGEAALRGVKTRVSEGEFDNGRGLNTRFTIVEEAPNKRATILGTGPIDSANGSGRGFDGTSGWDKSFIGSGLRVLEGRELADAGRDADLLRPLHLLDDCVTTAVEVTTEANVVVCKRAGGSVRHHFDRRTGYLIRQDIETARSLRVLYDDYRAVDGVQLPFKTWTEVAGATIKYNTESVRQNQAIDGQVFKKAAS